MKNGETGKTKYLRKNLGLRFVRPSVCPSRIKRRHPPEFFSFWACHNIRTCWIVLWWHLLWIFVGSLSIYFLITGPSWSYGFLRFFFFFRIRVLLTSFLILFSWYTCVSISSRAISFTRVRYIAPSLHRQGSLFHITPLVSPLSLSLSLFWCDYTARASLRWLSIELHSR